MDYDLEPLRETELSDLRTHGIFQVPIMNFVSFFSGRMGRGAKQKEMIISPLGSFLRMQGITYELSFFLRLMKLSVKLQ